MTKNSIYCIIGLAIGLGVSGYFIHKKLKKQDEEADCIIEEFTTEFMKQIHDDMMKDFRDKYHV